MSIFDQRLAAILGMSALLASCLLVLPPVRQDPGYHHFADARTLLGIPNFWNVISNRGSASLTASWWREP